VRQSAESEDIAKRAETADLSNRKGGNVGVMPKRLPTINVAQMHFDRWYCYSGDRISNRNAGMGISSRVDQQSMLNAHRSMNRVHQSALVVRLKRLQMNAKLNCCILQ